MIPQWTHEEVKQERDEANQRCEWVAAALHGDPIFGNGAVDSLVIRVNALRAQLDKARTVTDAKVELAAEAMCDDARLYDESLQPWSESGLHKDEWRESARKVLTAALTQEYA